MFADFLNFLWASYGFIFVQYISSIVYMEHSLCLGSLFLNYVQWIGVFDFVFYYVFNVVILFRNLNFSKFLFLRKVWLRFHMCVYTHTLLKVLNLKFECIYVHIGERMSGNALLNLSLMLLLCVYFFS